MRENIRSLDFNRLKEFDAVESGGETLLAEVVRIFINYAPPLSWQLELRASKGDWIEAGKLAHSLKSSCSNVGAVHLSRLCNEFEKKTEHSDQLPRAALDEHVLEVVREFREVMVDLNELEAAMHLLPSWP